MKTEAVALQAEIKKFATPIILTSALFATGWWTGQYGQTAWNTVKKATIDSYMNRYLAMSESGVSSIVYYVSTRDASSLLAMADSSTEILAVDETKIDNLFDVRINYSTRVSTVKSLRAMDNIDAVITLPLICH